MIDQPIKVKELLDTYRLRLEMQKDGITTPPSHIKDFVKTLVDKLSELDPNEKINLKNTKTGVLFIRKKSGKVLVKLDE